MEVSTALWYLEGLSLYEKTKPYVVNIPLPNLPADKRTNQVCRLYPGIRVRDIASSGHVFTLDRNGFELTTSIPISLDYEEFHDRVKVKEVYCENVKAALLDRTGAEFGEVIHQAVGDSLFGPMRVSFEPSCAPYVAYLVV